MSIPTLASLAVAALVTLGGCSVELGSSTEGEEGRVRFSYASSSCLFGCAIDRPILAGSSTRISMDAGGARELWAVSSDPDVTVWTRHAYSCCRSSGSSTTCAVAREDRSCEAGWTLSIAQSMEVTTRKAGSARIRVTDAEGAYVDAITLAVADPAQVVLTAADQPLDRVDLMVGAARHLVLEARDARGQLLEAQNGLSLSVEDKGIASFDDAAWLEADPAGVASVRLGGWSVASPLRGRKAGTTTLTLRAGKYARDVVVTVK